MLPQGVEEDITGTGDTAAHHKHLGVGGGGNGGQRHAQGVGHLVHLTGGQCIACTGGIKDILGGKVGAAQGAGGVRVLVQQLLHTADHAGGTGILLQTAVLAAAADRRLVGVDGDVADLAACTVCTFDDPAVDDDTAADTGAQRDHHRAAAALGTAHPDLAQRGHVGIVAHQHLDAIQQAGQLDGDVPLTPAAEVGADNGHDAAVQHRAGHTDPHALHLLGSDAVFLHLVLHGLGQVPKDVFTCIGGVGGHLPLFQQSARRGEQAHLGRGAAQVDAECVLFHIHLPLLCGGQAAGFLIVIIITYPFAKDRG